MTTDRRVLGCDDTVLTSSSIGNPSFETVVEAAAAAGFAGVSLWPEPTWQRARDEGWTDADMRAALAENDLVVSDVDALVAWVGPDDPGGPYFEEPATATLLAAAEALGARLVNVLLIGPREATVEDAAASFAAVCRDLAEHGLAGMLEFARGTAAPDPDTARRIVELSGCTNGGILVDAWHLHFGRGTTDMIRALPAALLSGVQLNDAPAERPSDFAHATRYDRLAPGQGAADLVGLLQAVAATGAQVPLTVEVFSDRLLRQHGPHGLAALLAQQVTTLREAARTSY